MDLQYHVDLMVAVNHEHHKALLEEAEIERLFHQAQQADANPGKFSQILGQVRCQISALRARVIQV